MSNARVSQASTPEQPEGSRQGLFYWASLSRFLRPRRTRSSSELFIPDLMSFEAPCPLTLPLDGDLPGEAATLSEIGQFVVRFDPTRHFRERWGERYRDEIDALWTSCVNAYRARRAPAQPAGELLLCLAYDWRLGPCLGISEHEKPAFVRWVLLHVRSALACATVA